MSENLPLVKKKIIIISIKLFFLAFNPSEAKSSAKSPKLYIINSLSPKRQHITNGL